MKPLRLLELARIALGLRRARPDRAPRFLTYLVTFSCNARCLMCDSWRKPSRDALTLDEIERVFRQLPRMDGVRLTGGEPFVRPDLPAIARLAEELLDPLLLHITSNGFLTDRIVRFCEQRARRMPLQLLISLDGVDATHNAIRGKEGAWKNALATLEALAGRRRELRLTLAVNQTVVDAEGLEQYRRLGNVLRSLGIHHQVVFAYDESATYGLATEKVVAPQHPGEFRPLGRFDLDDLREALEEMLADVRELPWTHRIAKRYYLEGIRRRLLRHAALPNPRCVALRDHLRILPNGDVPTCQFNTVRAGNLRRQSFAEVWHGVDARRQRQWVDACPGCWAECEVVPNALYSGDLLRGHRSRARYG
jgi:Fe-coproporphyrin III synthase